MTTMTRRPARGANADRTASRATAISFTAVYAVVAVLGCVAVIARTPGDDAVAIIATSIASSLGLAAFVDPHAAPRYLVFVWTMAILCGGRGGALLIA